MIRYWCDGCNTELSAQEFVAQNPWNRAAYMTEVFCTKCGPHAEAYWTDKLKIVNEVHEKLNIRLTDHRRGFFKKLKHESPSST